nr:NADH dehydrogenase subunit 2 [Chydorus sphaericus]
MSPSILLYSLCIMASIFMMFSTSSVFTAWLALELNTMAFIPFILFQTELKTGESSIKYFLSQTLGSILILISTSLTDQFYIMSSVLLVSALSLKLAVAPFHAWLPSMISKMSWSNLFMLLVVQKINPLIMLCSIELVNFILLLSVVSISVGSLTGVTQTQTRKLMVFSSINQMGWVLAASCINTTLCYLFFILYGLMLWPVLSSLKLMKLEKLAQLIQMTPTSLRIILFLNLLSLGGLPPFMGFLTKWMVLSGTSSFFVLFIMISMSLVTLLFYLRITLTSFVLATPNEMGQHLTKMPFHLILMTQISLSMLFISFLI